MSDKKIKAPMRSDNMYYSMISQKDRELWATHNGNSYIKAGRLILCAEEL